MKLLERRLRSGGDDDILLQWNGLDVAELRQACKRDYKTRCCHIDGETTERRLRGNQPPTQGQLRLAEKVQG